MAFALDPTALDGLYYGTLAALAVHHLVAFAVRREPTRLLFVGFLSSLALSGVVSDGVAFARPGPGAGAWNRSALVALDALTVLFATVFTRAYLGSPRRTPRTDPLLRAVALLSALAIPLSAPETWALGFELVGLLALVGPPALLGASLAAWRAGFTPARPYLLAQGCLILGLLVKQGVAAEWGRAGGDAGVLAMVVVASYGLAQGRREHGREAERLEAERGAGQTSGEHDAPTGLWNRRHLDETLQQIWQRALREEDVVSLLRVEVDLFEAFEQAHGARAGDECLRRVAVALAEVAGLGSENRLGRSERAGFAAVLPGTSRAAAARLAEAMRAAVAALGIPHDASTAADHVTVSVGVGCRVPDDEPEPKLLVDAADRALERARSLGRDRVCSAR